QFERHHPCRSERTRAARLTHERIRRLLAPVHAHSKRLTTQSDQPLNPSPEASTSATGHATQDSRTNTARPALSANATGHRWVVVGAEANGKVVDCAERQPSASHSAPPRSGER